MAEHVGNLRSLLVQGRWTRIDQLPPPPIFVPDRSKTVYLERLFTIGDYTIKLSAQTFLMEKQNVNKELTELSK